MYFMFIPFSKNVDRMNFALNVIDLLLHVDYTISAKILNSIVEHDLKPFVFSDMIVEAIDGFF